MMLEIARCKFINDQSEVGVKSQPRDGRDKATHPDRENSKHSQTATL